MSVLLLRTLSTKSIIGFGVYKDLTVQNLLDTNRQIELLRIYYNFRNIDFCKEIKDQLCIIQEREINKRDKLDERFLYKDFISVCLKDIVNKRSEEEKNISLGLLRKEKARNIKNSKRQISAKNKHFHSKIANRTKNQWT